MIVRHIIFAGLFATATFANANTVDASTVTVQPAWTFNAGTAANGPTAFQSSLAGPGGTWSAHSRLGDVGSSSTMLFSQRGAAFATAPVTAAATASSQPTAAAAPQAAAIAAQAAVAPQAAAREILVTPAAAPDMAQVNFTDTAAAPAATQIPAPDATDMAAIVVAADVISADAPVALAAIPEPATGMLMLVGLLGAGFMSRRRK